MSRETPSLGNTACMRAIWKGTVSFGLVTIPVKLFSATEERDVSFHQVRKSDGSRIRYKRIAEADGEEVAYGDIGKGISLPDGNTLVLDDDDFADLPLPSTREIDVHEFVPLEQVDPIYYAKSYYLDPDKTGVKPYVLLRDALVDSGRVALVKVAIRNREQLAVLRVRDGVIVLETMIWPDEVRKPDFAFLDEEVTTRPAEAKMAESLVDSMAGDFDPGQYKDDYREALQQVIDAKVEGREIVETDEVQSPRSDNVVDLMAALRASVDAAKKRRGEASGEAPDEASDEASDDERDAKPAARKTAAKKATKAAAKKAPAKKAAKKAAAKKAPARKSA